MKTITEQIDDEIRHLTDRIGQLRAAKAALTGSPSRDRPMAVKTPQNARKRAPKGHLEEQIMAVLAGTDAPGLTTAEVRDRLMAGGYGFSLAGMHLLKTLNRMDGLILDKSGKRNRYSLKKNLASGASV